MRRVHIDNAQYSWRLRQAQPERLAERRPSSSTKKANPKVRLFVVRQLFLHWLRHFFWVRGQWWRSGRATRVDGRRRGRRIDEGARVIAFGRCGIQRRLLGFPAITLGRLVLRLAELKGRNLAGPSCLGLGFVSLGLGGII